jgi:hypothetical protein
MKKKCVHQDKHEVIVHTAKKINGYLIVRQGVLISECQLCDRQDAEYMGYAIIDDGNFLGEFKRSG